MAGGACVQSLVFFSTTTLLTRRANACNKCNASHMCRLLKFFVVPVPSNKRVTGNRLGGAIINHSIDDIASVAQFAIIVADGVDCERYAELSSSICPVTQLNIRIE